jgi:two-component system, cell cycle sensor histidine kinase and response regulator CckA
LKGPAGEGPLAHKASAGASERPDTDLNGHGRGPIRGGEALESVGILMALSRASDGVILEVNDAYCAIVGRDRSELIGRKSTALDLYVDDSERDRIAAEVMATGSVHDRPVAIRLPDGRTGDLAFTISRMDLAGEACFMVAAVDVGRERAAQQALRASEARFAAIFKHAGVMMLLTRPRDGIIIDANDAFLRDTGYSLEEVIGKTARELSLFADPQDSIRMGARIMKDGYVRDFEVPVVARNGDRGWALFSATVTILEDEPHLILAIANTTERHRADEALRASEERYRDLVVQTADGVASVGDDGRILDTNPAMAELFGRTVEELTGSLWTDYIDPADLAARPFVGPRLGVGRGTVFERRIRRPDGSTVEVEVHVRRSKSGAMLGTVRDIGARKAAEQERARLYQAIEQSAESIVITGPDGTIVYVNPAFEHETGYARTELVGQRNHLLGRDDGKSGVFESMRAGIEANGTWSAEVVSSASDGSTLLDLVTASPVCDSTGALVNYVAVHHNIVRERELEDQLRQAQKMEAVGRLAGGVAHDFNNLLTAISGFTELATGEAEPGSELAGYLSEIRASAERATVLTRQLLAFGRRAVLQQRVLDLNQVVSDLAPMLQRIIGENVLLEVRMHPHLGRTLADRGQVEQIIVNLAVNGRDAMPAGGTLSIETENVTLRESDLTGRPELKPGQFVRMSISDTGIGMDAATVDRIFEPFFTTKSQGNGTGLGLATVFGIVGGSGGQVTVQSEPGRGAVFRVDLPVAHSELNEEDRPAAPTEVVAGRETILVVEDEPAVLGFAVRLLERNGYTVLRASTGEQAVEIARDYSGRIDLLFSDIVMPGLTGHETSDAVRGLRPEIRHLLASGYSEEMNAQRGALPLGIPFIGKPYSAAALLSAVRRALDGDGEAGTHAGPTG